MVAAFPKVNPIRQRRMYRNRREKNRNYISSGGEFPNSMIETKQKVKKPVDQNADDGKKKDRLN